MKSDLAILKDIASGLYTKINPMVGTDEASEIVGVGAGGDKTKKIDFVAEKFILSQIGKSKLSGTIVTEERGVIKDKKSENFLIIDPVDGTDNAVHGLPLFATSLAISKGPKLSRVCTGVVMDLFHVFTYWAIKGKGAESDFMSMDPSHVESIEEALISVDLNASKNGAAAKQLNILHQASHIRHFGVSALELCYVSSGLLDAYVNIGGGLRITDIAAAYLILKEAGGLILTPDGDELDASTASPTERISFIAASNIKLANDIIELL